MGGQEIPEMKGKETLLLLALFTLAALVSLLFPGYATHPSKSGALKIAVH